MLLICGDNFRLTRVSVPGAMVTASKSETPPNKVPLAVTDPENELKEIGKGDELKTPKESNTLKPSKPMPFALTVKLWVALYFVSSHKPAPKTTIQIKFFNFSYFGVEFCLSGNKCSIYPQYQPNKCLKSPKKGHWWEKCAENGGYFLFALRAKVYKTAKKGKKLADCGNNRPVIIN